MTTNKATVKKKDTKGNPVKGLTIAVVVFAAMLILSVVLIFVVSRKINSMEGALPSGRLWGTLSVPCNRCAER